MHELGAEGGHLPAPPPNSRLILLALADRCGPDGRSAWPTVETLSLEVHCSESSVRRALKNVGTVWHDPPRRPEAGSMG
ncbi:helix-turn-helix domain-containing protein [Bifidobacterium breve]|uniref:helix-turn-helix domain-containing protein n=1 Tax=Bifidobacterium breve TaxID=1685 RepID=UPI003B01009F